MYRREVVSRRTEPSAASIECASPKSVTARFPGAYIFFLLELFPVLLLHLPHQPSLLINTVPVSWLASSLFARGAAHQVSFQRFPVSAPFLHDEKRSTFAVSTRARTEPTLCYERCNLPWMSDYIILLLNSLPAKCRLGGFANWVNRFSCRLGGSLWKKSRRVIYLLILNFSHFYFQLHSLYTIYLTVKPPCSIH